MTDAMSFFMILSKLKAFPSEDRAQFTIPSGNLRSNSFQLFCCRCPFSVARKPHYARIPPLELTRHDLIRGAMTIGKSLDVDDHLLAHLDSPFGRGRAHVGQADDI